MRFFEFRIPPHPLNRGEFSSRAAMHKYTHDYRAWKLNETVDPKKTEEFEKLREFLLNFVTDPNELIVGNMYYILEVFIRVESMSVAINYNDVPKKYKGVRLNDFLFDSEHDIKYEVPGFDDDTVKSEYGPYLHTKTIFTTKEDRDSVVSTLVLRIKSTQWALRVNPNLDEDIAPSYKD